MDFKDFDMNGLYIGEFKEFVTPTGKCMFIGDVTYSPEDDNLHVPIVFRLPYMKAGEIKKQFGRNCITLFPKTPPKEFETIEQQASTLLREAIKSVVQKYYNVSDDNYTLKIFVKLDHNTLLYENDYKYGIGKIDIDSFNYTIDNLIEPHVQITSIVKYADEEDQVVTKISIKLTKAIIFSRGPKNEAYNNYISRNELI